MYGLKQAACIPFDRILKLLKTHGYYPLHYNPRIWCNEPLPDKSAICVEDFGIKYINTAYAHYPVDILKKYYTISIDWLGKNYFGLTLDWNYDKKYVNVSMTIYIAKDLHKLQH